MPSSRSLPFTTMKAKSTVTVHCHCLKVFFLSTLFLLETISLSTISPWCACLLIMHLPISSPDSQHGPNALFVLSI